MALALENPSAPIIVALCTEEGPSNLSLNPSSVSGPNETLPQLYRFCFLMTGEESSAEQNFQAVLRLAAERSTRGAAINSKLWLFREARLHCLKEAKSSAQSKTAALAQQELTENAAAQLARVAPADFGKWIAATPEPQRSAVALFYLGEFSYREILEIVGLRRRELALLLAQSRRQLQAWLSTGELVDA